MDSTLMIALLAGLGAALPALLLYYYRATIPPGVLWATVLGLIFFPVVGWLVALYVALKDWGYDQQTQGDPK